MPRSKEKKGSSSTPGKSKGANCQRSQLKNLYSKDPRAYRTRVDEYQRACKEVDNQKGNRSSSGTVTFS